MESRGAKYFGNKPHYILVELSSALSQSICATVVIVVESSRGRFVSRGFESDRQCRALFFRVREVVAFNMNLRHKPRAKRAPKGIPKRGLGKGGGGLEAPESP